MTGLWSLAFWKAAGERGIRAAAASLASLLVADGTGLLETAWVDRGSVAGMAGLVSVLLSVAAGSANPDSGPSFGTETPSGNVVAIADGDDVYAGPASSMPNGTPAAVINADLV